MRQEERVPCHSVRATFQAGDFRVRQEKLTYGTVMQQWRLASETPERIDKFDFIKQRETRSAETVLD